MSLISSSIPFHIIIIGSEESVILFLRVLCVAASSGLPLTASRAFRDSAYCHHLRTYMSIDADSFM